VRSREFSVSDIISATFNFEVWWKYVVTSIILFVPYFILSFVGAFLVLVTTSVAGGTGFLIGILVLLLLFIYFVVKFIFASYFIVDEKVGPLTAISKSWRLSKGNVLSLILLFVALLFINLIGLIFLLVGLLVTIPLSVFALARTYDVLSGVVPAELPNDANEENESSQVQESTEQVSEASAEVVENSNSAE